MKVTEFLKGRRVERQAVTRYINRHNDFFESHIKKVGKEIDLDDEAVEELDLIYPLEKPVEIVTDVETMKKLQVAMETIVKLQGQLNVMDKQIAESQATQLLLESAENQLSETKTKLEQKEELLDQTRSELEATKLELEKLKNRSFFQRLLNK